MTENLELTVSPNVDASRLARRFVEGVSKRYRLSPDTATALKVLASDAAADSMRSRHSLEIRVTCEDSQIDIMIHGAGLEEPAVVSPPSGLAITGGESSIHVMVQRT